jgi:two-component system, OmpR family, sensor kinase
MNPANKSLAQSLIRPLLFGCSLAFLLGTSLSVYIVKLEYDELLDLSLKSKAELLLPLMSANFDLDPLSQIDPLDEIEGPDFNPEEKASFWLVDAQGRVLAKSNHMPAGLDHRALGDFGYRDTAVYRYFSTRADAQGRRIIIAEPLLERNEAVRDSLLGIALSMFILVVIAFVVIRLSIRYVQRTITDLSDTIREKNENDLAPIDPALTFLEMAPATETINDLMARLGAALQAERDFATNAAHELRTPLAVSLAHTQRLKAGTTDAALLGRAGEIETGLKRLIHLVERLLQFSRAQSGLGASETAMDANVVTALLFKEAVQRPDAQGRIRCHPPEGRFASTIDADALAIMLSNLIDNALKHSPPDSMIELDARVVGEITISNDCAPLSPQDVEQIQHRHVRQSKTKDGFGLGMSIVSMICTQSGATLRITSPLPDHMRGIGFTLVLPAATDVPKA